MNFILQATFICECHWVPHTCKTEQSHKLQTKHTV